MLSSRSDDAASIGPVIGLDYRKPAASAECTSGRFPVKAVQPSAALCRRGRSCRRSRESRFPFRTCRQWCSLLAGVPRRTTALDTKPRNSGAGAREDERCSDPSTMGALARQAAPLAAALMIGVRRRRGRRGGEIPRSQVSGLAGPMEPAARARRRRPALVRSQQVVGQGPGGAADAGIPGGARGQPQGPGARAASSTGAARRAAASACRS